MQRAGTGRLPDLFDRGVLVLRLSIILITGLALSACSTGVTESLRAADASNAQCKTTPQPGGGSTMDCTLWQRTTTKTATTLPTGETITTVERTRTGGAL